MQQGCLQTFYKLNVLYIKKIIIINIINTWTKVLAAGMPTILSKKISLSVIFIQCISFQTVDRPCIIIVYVVDWTKQKHFNSWITAQQIGHRNATVEKILIIMVELLIILLLLCYCPTIVSHLFGSTRQTSIWKSMSVNFNVLWKNARNKE